MADHSPFEVEGIAMVLASTHRMTKDKYYADIDRQQRRAVELLAECVENLNTFKEWEKPNG